MKLKREDGYWSLHRSTLGDWIRGSAWLKNHTKALLIIIAIFLLFGCPLTFGSAEPSALEIFTLIVFMPFILPLIIAVALHHLVYGSFRGRPPTKVDLPNAEFHSLGTCRNYGKRILNMIKDLNVAEHYIFLLNFHNLFYNEEHRLENPDQKELKAIGRAMGVLPEIRRSTVWTRNPFQAVGSGIQAGKEVGEEQTLKYVSDKLGGLPEPREAVSIITKEYLPELTREFPRDVAMLIAVVLCSAHRYTAVFPYDHRVVTEKQAVRVASNPTRKNVVNYCSKFAWLSVEEPVARRKGLMED